MDPTNTNPHLSRISTLWSLVCQAHNGPTEDIRAAQRKLLDRYGGAVRRYLLGAVRDPETAEELFQEFAYRFLHGDLRGADPQRGRFRGYVKGVLFHLIADFHRRRQRQPKQLGSDHPEPAAPSESIGDADHTFLAGWRDELLARSWAALQQIEQTTGKPFYTVLRFRAEHADMPSHEMAKELSERLGKPLTAVGVRQTLHRARDKFADLLLDEVAQSLQDATPEQIDQELIDLGLMDYCRSALQRRGQD